MLDHPAWSIHFSTNMTDSELSNLPTLSAQQEISLLLEAIIDPEAGINIVDMGLIYGIWLEANCVCVQMTMTSPACPVGDVLIDEVTECLRAKFPLPTDIKVDLTFNPPWSPDMMSEAAKSEFGWS